MAKNRCGTAIAGVFTYLRGRWSAQASEAIARSVRDRVYNHLQHLPCTYHDHAETGDLVQRCTSDVETVRMFLSTQVIEIANARRCWHVYCIYKPSAVLKQY